jgi:prepilin-type N-terminal cleavage/methylation domain-containing protein
MNYSKPKAFTLVEILVVIAVIGLLSSIIFAITRGADEQGRIARGLYFSQHLQNSLGSYAAGIWNFDEGSGTAANDISGWENNGTLVNSPTWRCAATDTSYTPSGQGCSLEFNGSTSYIEVGDKDSLDFNIGQDFTAEAWIKTTVNSRMILSKGGAGETNKGYWLYVTGSGHFEAGLTDGVSPRQLAQGSTRLISDGKWHHVVAVFDRDDKLILYVDGSYETNINISEGDLGNTYGFNIGRNSQGASQYFSGLIDEVRIYGTALTAAKIRDQYYAGLENLLAKGRITEQEYSQRAAS